MDAHPFGPEVPLNTTIELNEKEPPMAIQLRPFDMDYVVGVTGGRFGQWLEDAGSDASIAHLTVRLVAAFGSDIRKALTSRTIVTAWGGDPWTLGSYSGALPGKAHQRRELARPVEDILYFAGEATSPDCAVRFGSASTVISRSWASASISPLMSKLPLLNRTP